jgi:hypothetical protein
MVLTKVQQERLALLVKRTGRALEDLEEMLQERAAIREFEGGAKRKNAEHDALDDVANEVLK